MKRFFLGLIVLSFLALELVAQLQEPPSPPRPTGPFPFSEATAQALAELEEVVARNRVANYEVTIVKPLWSEFGKLSQAHLYRRCEPDGAVSLQLDLYRDGELLFTFVQNRDGLFGHSEQFGWSLRMHDCLRLFQLEALANPVTHLNMRILDVSKDTITASGREMTSYRFQLPDWVETKYPLRDLMRCYTFSKNPAEFKEEHATIWEYLVDEATGLLVQRRAMNAKGKLCATASLGDYRLVKDWKDYPHLFQTPKNLQGEVLTTEGFLLTYTEYVYDRNNRKALEQATTSRRKAKTRLQRIGEWLTGPWSLRLLLAVGIGLLAGSFWLRRRRGE